MKMNRSTTPLVSAVPMLANVDHLTGETIVRLMRAHGRTLESVASGMGVSQARVRAVRERGVAGLEYVLDWAEGITGVPQLSWCDVARLYLSHSARIPLASDRGGWSGKTSDVREAGACAAVSGDVAAAVSCDARIAAKLSLQGLGS